MKLLTTVCLCFVGLAIYSQDIEIIESQWTAIQKAKTAKEKLMRNCRMGGLVTGGDFNYETGKIKRETDLNVIEGISDLMDDSSRIRLVSRFFEIERGKYNYNYDFACAFKRDSTFGMMFGRRACDNNHELSCKPCHLKSYVKDDWEGAYYTDLKTSYQDTMMYLHLKGEQYHRNGTVSVNHTFTVSPGCKIKFINDAQ